MNVYILDADVEKYLSIYYSNSDDIVEFNRRFDGSSLKKSWTGKEELEFGRDGLPKGDTPGLSSHIPVFSPRAVEILADLLKDSGELLPITCEGEDYFLFNVTRLVDALDEDASELERFDDGGILRIARYGFKEDLLIGVNIFKLPQKPLSYPYVTDAFVHRVEDSALSGFEFRLVWSSD
jgi:hypothetical protein